MFTEKNRGAKVARLVLSRKLTLAALMVLGLGMSAVLHASLVSYVDYDDGNNSNGVHDENIRDGDFGGQTAYNVGGTVPPVELPWVDIGTEAARFRTDKSSGVGSDLNEVAARNRIIALDTGYTIRDGDNSFSVSFMWRDASGWDDNSDRVKLTLYYTSNNQPGGTATDLYTLTSQDSQTDNSYQTESYSGTFDDQGGEGKKLFLRLYADCSGGEFARVDNIYLALVPEPGATAWGLLLAGWWGWRLRQRRRATKDGVHPLPRLSSPQPPSR